MTINWPGDGNPAGQPNFESLARKYRFQILGKACEDHGIDSLFLAHHEDDQAETVLMRMIQGHRGPGLRGIETSSEIPECHGIYGVHQSGGIGPKPPSAVEDSPEPEAPSSTQSPKNKELSRLVIEQGGVRIYRPLLGFSKAGLKATCRDRDIPWFEDHTNANPTLTTRNAIRHMYNNHRLPKALSKLSILSLSQCLHEQIAFRNAVADDWFSKCSISNLDTCAGTLSIRFPFPTSQQNTQIPTGRPISPSHILDHRVAALLLRKVLMLVSPQENINTSSLHGAVERIFPKLYENDHSSSPPRTSFTVAGVKIQPRGTGPPKTDPKQHLNENEWFLSRQPHHTKVSNRPLLTIPPAPQNQTKIKTETEYPREDQWTLPWTLYDNRFWIRVQNPFDTPLHIRPFAETDIKACKKIQLSKGTNWSFVQRLRQRAPGDVRWTLPAIVVKLEEGKERVLALPTLGVDVAGDVKCEVRYKHVDLGVPRQGKGPFEGRGGKQENKNRLH